MAVRDKTAGETVAIRDKIAGEGVAVRDKTAGESVAIRDKIAGGEAVLDKIAGGEAVRDNTAEEVEAVREAAGRVEEPGVESPVEAKKGPPGRRRWWNVRGERTQ